jgi:hypothetical protein
MLALTGSTQLTRLEWRLSDRESTRVGARTALASLTSLKELVLGQEPVEHTVLEDVEMKYSLDALHLALQSLTCLTYCAIGGVPAQRFLDVLPVGLVELKLGSQLPQRHMPVGVRKLAHSTNVTKLKLPSLVVESVLPPLVCSLACNSYSVQPLLPLRHLKRPSICQSYGINATTLRQLSELNHTLQCDMPTPGCSSIY